MEKLNKLISNCKCGVYITINEHRDFYETVEKHMEEESENNSSFDIDSEILEKMKELNTIIELQFYPDTPIGCYIVYHYDLEKAIDEALEILKIN